MHAQQQLLQTNHSTCLSLSFSNSSTAKEPHGLICILIRLNKTMVSICLSLHARVETLLIANYIIYHISHLLCKPGYIVISLKASVWRYPNSEQNRIQNFFWYQTFSNTESKTFFDAIFFRYFFRNHPKKGKVLKPRSCKTETSSKIPQIWTILNPTFFR